MGFRNSQWKTATVLSVVAFTSFASVSAGSGASFQPFTSFAHMRNDSTQTLTWFTDVNWWTMGKWNTDPNTVEGYITKKFGISFEFNVPAQDADTKLHLMLVSGKLPDIISLQDGTTEQELIKSGKVWNLEEFFKKYDPTALTDGTFPPDLVKLEKQTFGGFYSVPSWASTPDMVKKYPPAQKDHLYSANQAVIYNEHIMKQAGLKLADLKTEDGLLKALQKVKSMHLTYKGAPVIPLQIDNSNQWYGSTVQALAQMFGAMPVDQKGNYRDLILSPEMKHAIDFLFKAAQMGALDRSQITLDTNGTNNVVRSGRVFCFIGNTANPHPETMWQTDPTETWVSPGPLLSNPYRRPTFGHAQYGLGWTQTYVSKSVQNPQIVAKWMHWMYSYDGEVLTNYGFAGKDYTVKNGLIYPTAQAKKYPSNYWETTGLGAFWFFNNGPFFSHVSPPPSDESGKMVQQFKSAWPSSPLTYVYDSTPLQMPATLIPPGSQLFQIQQQIRQYEETQVAKMIFAPDAKTENQIYQQTIAQLHKMGLDQLQAVYNQQFHKQEQAFGEHLKGINP
ncbi:hypothetical protein GCM10010885_21570 [Alicyclobacillus cellulosilyticus]|uniref:Aldouronate transport system substrate-binding protein n=1 Tax=Alicyclobacillus cellulosilyticus TaxID=1003997 RepID=A0A917NMF6_9BACL|nr:hypothetical protein [Alicyclobacillus cellulosilyticus]GGJ11912.1 hypothetical protein GCM10010885_21570 [Alicyclobacillus cellulosilyticus]